MGFTGSFYFHTDDVDALWDKLKDKAKICYGIENVFHGMREFGVYDNNGYLLQFGQEIAMAD
ncbi:MAG: VOC family protein [Pyrinomonadaceae bacterium]